MVTEEDIAAFNADASARFAVGNAAYNEAIAEDLGLTVAELEAKTAAALAAGVLQPVAPAEELVEEPVVVEEESE